MLKKLLTFISISAVSLFAMGANPGQGGEGAPSAGMGQLLPMMIMMFVIIYFFMIRPQKKKQNETKSMLESIKKGDKLVTAGGFIVSVVSIKGAVVTVKMGQNEVELRKTSIADVLDADKEKKMREIAPEKK